MQAYISKFTFRALSTKPRVLGKWISNSPDIIRFKIKKKKAKFNYHLNGKGIFFFLFAGEKSLKFPAEERKPR